MKTKLSKILPAFALAASAFGAFTASNAFATEHDAYFDPFLSTDGRYIIQSTPPTSLEEAYTILELPYIKDDNTVNYSSCNADWTRCIFEHKVWDQSTMSWSENHSEEFGIFYAFDEDARDAVATIIEGVELPDIFHLHDLELLNYWSIITIGNANIGIPNFSSELKDTFANTNLDFEIDIRCGANNPLATENCGIGKVRYNDVLYHSYPFLNVIADHIFYVPATTAEADFVSTLQNRIDAYLGETQGIEITVEASNETVASVDPNYATAGYDFEITGSEPVYFINVSAGDLGDSFPVLIRKATSSDDLFTPTLSSTDLMTGVNIKSSDLLPGDTMTYAYDYGNLTGSDEENARIVNIIGKDNFNVYELGLYSAALGNEISDGDFTVSTPIPESLKGLRLSAYWVNYETGEAEEHYATIDGDSAVWGTDHFSTYYLAESSASRPADEESADETPEAPNSGAFTHSLDGATTALPLSGIIIAGLWLIAKKR